MADPPPRYCAAPWTTGVYRVDGVFLPCERNHTPYGEWQSGRAPVAWNSEVAQFFRSEIGSGRFPNSMCERCYKNNNQTRFLRVVEASCRTHCAAMRKGGEIEFDADRLETILRTVPAVDPKDQIYVQERLDKLQALLTNPGVLTRSTTISALKLSEICRAALAYCQGSTLLEYAPLSRIVNLISVCNARCIQCPFLFTGEIIDGYPAADGSRIREMDGTVLVDIFADSEVITDFFMYGSEFLLYRHWKEVAAKLNEGGVKLSISSNGMTLNEKNIDYLIDNEVFAFLNISFDGSDKETIEFVRKRVSFDRLSDNVRYLFDRLQRSPRFFHNISFSFCLMTDNYRSLAKFIPLLVKLRGSNTTPFSIQIHSLAPLDFAGPDYRKFIELHHHTNIDRSALINELEAVQAVAEREGILVGLFYNWLLADFANKGYPFPGMT